MYTRDATRIDRDGKISRRFSADLKPTCRKLIPRKRSRDSLTVTAIRNAHRKIVPTVKFYVHPRRNASRSHVLPRCC